nr:hypothetical protein 1634Bnrm2_p123 [Cryptomonas sp.]
MFGFSVNSLQKYQTIAFCKIKSLRMKKLNSNTNIRVFLKKKIIILNIRSKKWIYIYIVYECFLVYY